MLQLYQYEGCPFCEHVREAMDDLGLDYVIRTVPREHSERDRVEAVSGQPLVPVLVDPGKDRVVVDSREIIKYLRSNYRT